MTRPRPEGVQVHRHGGPSRRECGFVGDGRVEAGVVGDHDQPERGRRGPEPAPARVAAEANGQADGRGHQRRLDVVAGVAGRMAGIEPAAEQRPAVAPVVSLEEEREDAGTQGNAANHVLGSLEPHPRGEPQQRPVCGGEPPRPTGRQERDDGERNELEALLHYRCYRDRRTGRADRQPEVPRHSLAQERDRERPQRRQREQSEDRGPPQRLRRCEQQPAEEHERARQPHVDPSVEPVDDRSGDQHDHDGGNVYDQQPFGASRAGAQPGEPARLHPLPPFTCYAHHRHADTVFGLRPRRWLRRDALGPRARRMGRASRWGTTSSAGGCRHGGRRSHRRCTPATSPPAEHYLLPHLGARRTQPASRRPVRLPGPGSIVRDIDDRYEHQL